MIQCDPGSASRMIDTDCKCHMLIKNQKITTQYGTQVDVAFEVLAASDPSQKGKVHAEFFPCEGKAVDKFYNLAEAAGLVTAEQRKTAVEAGQGLNVDETLLKGRQVCVDIKMEPNMRKNPATGETEVNPEKPGPYPRIGFRSFAVDSEKAKDIPKDMKILGMTPEQAIAQIEPQPQPQQQQPPQQTAPGDGMSW